ncbi:uncharacterized protein LOC143625051 [Bidens hawaiensis]|uniref:uncharacterized protein LOC143625051 n=1 Tax=Bidens hawaiensis TaxID=980011 RepID=UPI00404A07A2
MANAGVAKGSTVEVSSEEPGFHGAWYVATLLDDQLKYSPTPSSKTKSSSSKKHTTTKHKEIGYLVKYDTLLKEDSLDEPLTEIVNPTCVRPLPPRNLRRNNVNYAMGEGSGGGGGDDFEVYDVVDAYHREGWWIGVVNKVVNVAGNRKYVVLFENPPEEAEFGRSHLRLHVDWVDGRWQFPPKKVPEDERKRASEPDNDAHAGLTPTSKGTRTTDGDSANASPQPSSVPKTRSRKTTEKSSEMAVGAGKEPDSSRRNRGSKGTTKEKASVVEKRGSNDVHEDSPVTEPEMNKITTTPDVDIPTVAPQPSSVIKSRSMKISERSSEAVGVVKALDPSPGSKGSTKAKESKSDAVCQDSPLMEHEANQTATETCEAEASQSPQKKSKVNPPKLLAKEPISSQGTET